MSCDPPNIGLDLVREESGNWEQTLAQGGVIRIRYSTANVLNIPEEIFLYQLGQPDPFNDNITVAEFIGVCRPSDLEEYPLSQPQINTPNPYFRLSYADGIFRATSDAQHFADTIPKEVDILVEALKRLHCLKEPEVLRIGDDDQT